MANMNMIIHDMEGQIEIGDTFKNPKFRDRSGKLRTFDRVVATAQREGASSNPEGQDQLSRIVDHAELKKNDYNITPSRYLHTSDAETYRPIAEIVEELNAIEAEARETDLALREILKQLDV